jgi:hypothetical protein
MIFNKTISKLYSPWIVLFLLFLILSARWIWIAGFCDYGWTYEPAYRILQGQVQYRDFLLTHPPLVNYTLAAFLALFGKSLWIYVIHLYLWWLFSLIVGLLIIQELGADRSLSISAVILAGTVSFQSLHLAHAHNYAPTVIAGLSILFILRYQKSEKVLYAEMAGLFAGICILAKQNVGIIISIAGFILFIYLYYLKRYSRRNLIPLESFSVGWLTGFILPLIFFGLKAGFKEVFLQMFKDPASAKGGLTFIAIKAFPRVILSHGIPNQRLLELLISTSILFTALILFYILLRRSKYNNPLNPLRDHDELIDHYKSNILIIYFILLITLSITSIFNISIIKSFIIFISNRYIDNYFLFIVYILYIIAFSLFIIIFVIKSTRNNFYIFIPCFLMISLSLGQALAGPWKFCSSAGVTIPIIMFIFSRTQLYPKVSSLGIILAMIMIVLFYLFPVYTFTFEPLKKLPGNSPFAGLYARSQFQQMIKGMVSQVANKIKDKRTLWLCWPGPHSAIGGNTVFNVAFYYCDTYSSRSESRLKEDWQKNPPEFIVLSQFLAAENAKFLTYDSLVKWVSLDYLKVWEGKGWGDKDFSLWQKKLH